MSSNHDKRAPGRNPSGRGDVPGCCGIDFLGSEAPLSRDFECVRVSTSQSWNKTHVVPTDGMSHRLRKNEECEVGPGAQWGLNRLFGGDETSLFWKTRSCRQRITWKGADFIISEGFAPLPCPVDRNPRPTTTRSVTTRTAFPIRAISQ